MIFDPVPGGNATPSLGEPPEDRWLLESFLKYLNVPQNIREKIPTLIRGFVLLALLSLGLMVWNGYRRGAKGKTSRSELEPYLLRAESLTQPRADGETVKRWAQRVKDEPLAQLARIYERTFYQDRALSPKDHDELSEILRQLKKRAEP